MLLFKFENKLFVLFTVLSLCISNVKTCTLGEFPYQSVNLAEDTFVTYTGCESSDGQTVNNYLLHLEISRGTYSVKLDLQPYLVEESFQGDANIVLSTSDPVAWEIRPHHIANLHKINIYFLHTSTVEAPSGISLIQEQNIPTNFAGSLHWSSQLLNNTITLATTTSYANYMMLHLGNNFQFTGGIQTCQQLTAVINDTAAPLFISQRLKVYQRTEVTGRPKTSGCVNGFESRAKNSLVIGVLVNYTVPPLSPFSFPFSNLQPEVKLYLTTDHISQQGIELVLVSTSPIKWKLYQIGFQDLSLNIKVSDGSDVDVISQSIAFLTTQAESSYSTDPNELLSQLKSEFDKVNLFFNSLLADEISINVIRNETETAVYNFNEFLKESIAFEFCGLEAYLFCLNRSTIQILYEYSYELSINKTVCHAFDGKQVNCSVKPSLTLRNPQWMCFEIRASNQLVKEYSTEVRLQMTSEINNGTGDTLPQSRKRSLPDSPMQRAQVILGFQGSTGVLTCTRKPETPTILPPNEFSIQVINNNEEVTRYPTYIKMGTALRTDIKVSNISPGMQPILLSCYLSTSSSPVEANANQFPVMDIIRGGCPTREGRLFKASASYYNLYLVNKLFLQLSLVNSIEPFLVDSRLGRAQLIDKSHLHCQPSLCQLASSTGHNPTTGYPMCENLTTLCEMVNDGNTQLGTFFPKLYGSPFVSTGKLVFNHYNLPISSTAGSPPPPCANSSTPTHSPTPAASCDFKKSVYTVWPLFLVFFGTMPLTFSCGGLMFCILNRCSRHSSNSYKSKKSRKHDIE